MGAMGYFGYHGTVWEGAQDLGNNKFVCASGGACFGRTGDQVLASLSHTFAVTQENTMVRDICFILAYGIVFKILHVILAVAKTQFGNRNAVSTLDVEVKTETETRHIEEDSASSFV